MTVSALRGQLFSLENSLGRLAIPLQNEMLEQLFNRCNRLRLRCASVVLRLDAADVAGALPPIPVALVTHVADVAGQVATIAARFDAAGADAALKAADGALKRVEKLLPA
ncbi:hypothetical protein [Sandaracinobacter sp.]|jgi:hypothetical protein|uniref:hypothetical protein n=1 Tax=Sandaracinobacter sp. TaxID=2487581 RepID=UPI0035AEC27E